MSELALKLIAENKKTRSPFLDLGNCGLTEVPEEIGELVWLEELSFASEWKNFVSKDWVPQKSHNTGPKNNIGRLAQTTFRSRRSSVGKPLKSSPFSSLIKLKKLFLNGVWGESMGFKNLTPLSDLANLQYLILSFTESINLSPLSSLAKLKYFDVSHTPVVDLSPLAALANLRHLDVSFTELTNLSPLSRLVNLQQLYIWSMQVTDLSPLRALQISKILMFRIRQ